MSYKAINDTEEDGWRGVGIGKLKTFASTYTLTLIADNLKIVSIVFSFCLNIPQHQHLLDPS
jgi:hypothetical protein